MLQRGDVVTVMWRGAPRYGVVTGDAHADSLKTGEMGVRKDE